MSDGVRDLYLRHGAEIRRALVRRFGSAQDGLDDAVQTAFLRFGQLERRDQVANPRAFILVMARNLIQDSLRRAAVRQAWTEAEIHAPSAPVLEERTPESVLLEKERFAALEDAIARLPERQRRCLTLSRVEGLSYAEISGLTGWSPADISRQIARALMTLALAVGPDAKDDAP